MQHGNKKAVNIVIPSSADKGRDSTKSHPDDAELPVRRRWMQGLLRGRFTRGGMRSKPWTPKETSLRSSNSMQCSDRRPLRFKVSGLNHCIRLNFPWGQWGTEWNLITNRHVLMFCPMQSRWFPNIFFCVVSDPFTCKINNIHPFSTDLFSEQYRNTTIPKLTSLIKYAYENNTTAIYQLQSFLVLNSLLREHTTFLFLRFGLNLFN